MAENETFAIDQIPEPEDLQNVIYSMVAIPHLSPMNIFNDFASPFPEPKDIGKEDPSEAGIFQVDDNGKLFSMIIYADHRRLAIDPFLAAQILVAKAVRRLVCYGAEPTAMSAFLNNVDIANPLAQEMVMAARLGLDAAASAFNLQFSHRKIFYDYSNTDGFMPPTLMVSLVGKIENHNRIMTSKLKSKGHNIFLIGRTFNDINASEYLDHYHEIKESPLMHFNLAFESKLMNVIKEMILMDLVHLGKPGRNRRTILHTAQGCIAK